MANEITIQSKLSVTNGNLSLNVGGRYQFDQAAVGGGTPGYVTIGTSEESVSLSELGTEGWFWMINLDDTNYVQWGFSTAVYGGRMEAGEPAGPFRLEPSATLYLKADTAACKVQIIGLED